MTTPAAWVSCIAKFGLPVYATADTYEAANRYRLGDIGDLLHFRSGEALRFGKIKVETIHTPHDGVDGVVFVVDDGQHRLGILTDLGHVFADLKAIIGSLDAVLLESNYDPDMLADGPYPDWLKERIEGPGGHISNFEVAEVLQSAAKRMKWVCLAHLSQDNNTPKLALKTHRRILGDRLAAQVWEAVIVDERRLEYHGTVTGHNEDRRGPSRVCRSHGALPSQRGSGDHH